MSEIIHAGEPTAAPVIEIPTNYGNQAFMHGGDMVVATTDTHIALGIGHPEFEAGFYMGLSPDQARNLAAWLLNCANEFNNGAN